VPLFKLERIVVFGMVQVTAQAMALLLDGGIGLLLLSRHGKLRGRISSAESGNVYLRLAQLDRWKDRDARLRLAGSIVRGKLENQKVLCQRFLRRIEDGMDSGSIANDLQLYTRLIEKIETAKEIDSLMGIEGAGTALYFRVFGRAVKAQVIFPGRRKHPSTDPVNALLSLGYTMLTGELDGLAEAHGFECHVAFLHGIKYGRKSLALDLVEEFRHPVIDVFTLNLLNRRVITVADFEEVAGGGLHLLGPTLKAYFTRYEQWMTELRLSNDDGKKISIRDVLRRQVARMSGAVLKDETYVPYVTR
jgi:CRISPR-associated protein Cas1